MVVLTEIVNSMWSILKSFVPAGADPVLFYTTFLITAALVFAVLQVVSFFKNSRALSVVVALIIAYFTASSAFVTIMVSKLFPNIGLAIMAILGVMLVLVFLAPDLFEKGLGVSPVIGILIFLVIVWLTWVFAAPELQKTGILDTISGATGFGITNEDVALVITIAVVLGGLYFLFKGESKTQGESFFDKMFEVHRKP